MGSVFDTFTECHGSLSANIAAIFKKLVDDCLKFDNKLKLLRICGTGDATLNKELPAMVQYANSRDVSEKFEMITNGILLNEPTMKVLTDSLSRIIISIEGLSDLREILSISSI